MPSESKTGLMAAIAGSVVYVNLDIFMKNNSAGGNPLYAFPSPEIETNAEQKTSLRPIAGFLPHQWIKFLFYKRVKTVRPCHARQKEKGEKITQELGQRQPP